jgi:acetyltransferase-like isoleucine patch superfamily enzyme
MSNFYELKELNEFGFKSIGDNVLISRKASIYGAKNISIGNNVRIDDFCILSGNIHLGSNIHIAVFSSLFAGESDIYMDDFSGLSSRVSIYAVSDDYSGNYLTNPTIPDKYTNIIKGKVTLGKHAIIGTNSVVLPNVKIGEGVSIGACSLVIKDCDEWGIYIGIPVKKIKDRSKALLELEKEHINTLG